MPHSLFLGSVLATQDRISSRTSPDTETSNANTVDSKMEDPEPSENISYLRRLFENFKKCILGAFLKPLVTLHSVTPTRYSEVQNNPFEFVSAHIYHGMVDIVGSLLGYAVIINSLCVFFVGLPFDRLIPYNHQDFDARFCCILLRKW